TKEVDLRRIITNDELSVMEGGIRFWGKLKKKRDNWNYKRIMRILDHYGIDPNMPVKDYPQDKMEKILYGDKQLKTNGVVNAIKRLYRETQSPEMRIYYESFMSEKKCETCGGRRLNPEALSVTIGGRNIAELSAFSIAELYTFFQNLELNEQRAFIAKELVKEINSRLKFLLDVGLYYLMLDRKAPTLSGGESQRIRLASQIGSGLMGVLYILDEPSIGLHQRDNVSLIKSLKNLRDLGNTVIVVEHDRDTIEEADVVVEFGPGAGVFGGEITFNGTPGEMKKDPVSLTGQYLRYDKNISPKERERPLTEKWLKITGCRQNNLREIDVAFPLGVMTLVTGVSGSGKSSLIADTLFPALHNRLHKSAWETGAFREITGTEYIDKVIEINQDPIGRTPRSNPVTYVGVFTAIRELFASLPEAKIRGYKQGRFSFNVKGGRCEACGGTGLKEIEMHFLPNLYITCDVCKGKRYNRETLEVRYNGKSINDVLEMTVEEAKEFFANIPAISGRLKTLYDVGLGYIKLGQSATTLSGGEAQRVKLAKELSRQSTGNTFYILDEPTTGLHFDDVNKLLKVLNRLVDAGNTMVIIEHNLDVVKYADWIIDLGPEGGKDGGKVLYAGRLDGLFQCKNSHTGRYLKEYLAKE
ncbi:MAG TPA: excinuclease ABC subunit A, partial [Firmicutes bacterium]|nr:excinuclease ABC subunit A [Bacillota bacterium]